jgi:CRISPR-associated protein Cmr5
MAYAAIKTVQDRGDARYSRKYGGLCLKLPAMIQFNGLCQTLGFYEAKGKGEATNEHTRLLNDLGGMVRSNHSGAELAERARTAELPEYLHLSREALACSIWLKRYAEAVLRVTPGEEGDDAPAA